MVYSLTDTIAALATSSGYSALAVIRVSGTNALPIVAEFFSHPSKILAAKGYKAVHGYVQVNNQQIDEVICLIFRAPHSYTGEDVVEIICHGNPDIANRILTVLLTRCRAAFAGEFTFRAFMNGKLDLSQAEAVNDLIHARTSKAEEVALQQLKGELKLPIQSIQDTITDCRIQFELGIDFADQDLPDIDLSQIMTKLSDVKTQLQCLIKSGLQGKILREGYRVALAGPPNVGKSSLFNKLLNENRALVHSEPGTTRDYLETWLSLDGYPILLYDTAGLRNTTEQVEQMGIMRTQSLLETADLVIYLIDADCQADVWSTIPDPLPANYLIVQNKIDLLGYKTMPSFEDWYTHCQCHNVAKLHNQIIHIYPCSTLIPYGTDAVKEAILSQIQKLQIPSTSVLITNSRHLQALENALNSIEKALSAIESQAGYEFIAFDLLEASNHLSLITGAVTTDDLLQHIFSSFCIGK